MKTVLFCLMFVLFSISSFSQGRGVSYPPDQPDPIYWKQFTFYAGDANGREILDITDPGYKRFELEFLISAPSGHGIFSLYHDRVNKQILEFGEILEYSPNMRVIRIVGPNGRNLGFFGPVLQMNSIDEEQSELIIMDIIGGVNK